MMAMKTHYFPDEGDGWTALCRRTFAYIDGKISAYNLEDLTCNDCQRILKKRGLAGRKMNPLVALLILRRAISATDAQERMAMKSLGGEP
jgi:hypothetical protein